MLVVISITTYLLTQIVRSHLGIPKMNKRIFCTAFAFMLFNWMFGICVLFATAYNIVVKILTDRGITISAYNVLNGVAVFLALLQSYLLLIALFVRLSNLFQSGPLHLSRCTARTYTVTLSTIPILCLSVPVTRVLGADIVWQRAFAFAVLFVAETVLCSLLFLFWMKLKQTQKNKTLIAYHRRQSVVSLLSVFTHFCFLMAFGFQLLINVDRHQTPQYSWFTFAYTFIMPYHVLCNFLCVAVAYRCCDSLIVLFCGCLRCCRVIPITTDDHDAIFLEQIMKNSNDRTRMETAKHAQHGPPETRMENAVEIQSVASVPVGMGANSGVKIIYEY